MEIEPNIIFEREAVLLAPYAMHSADSAGRKHAEPPQAYRGVFQRDRDRILHSGAFRRLGHKTQVFTGTMGDYHRSRLTHTLEVASIARTLARALRLNEDLVEALALAHDIGHPPFGHSGEDVLDECLRDAESGDGGFNHNAQALRIVELLENRYPEFPGLNLSLRSARRADAPHRQNGGGRESAAGSASRSTRPTASPTTRTTSTIRWSWSCWTSINCSPFRCGAKRPARVRGRFADLDDQQLRRAIVHELINWQVGDLMASVDRALAAHGVASVADVRRAPGLVTPSAELADLKLGLERFLFTNVYRHRQVEETRDAARGALREMFDRLVQHPDRLPAKFQARAATDGVARAVVDYLAGMTDRYALEEHRRLTGK